MRITTSDLLMAGWHGIYRDNRQYWIHHDFDCPYLLFNEAARVEKLRAVDKLKKEDKGG